MNVAIVIHQGVELLDFAGPGEVFAAAAYFGKNPPALHAYTVSETTEPIISQGFLTVRPAYAMADCPQPDIIVIPGGGTEVLLQSEPMMGWLSAAARDARVVLSVCPGAFARAKLGLLDGLDVTTWYGAIDRLRAAAPRARVHENRRFVDNGKVVTTAGVSAGIDRALHVVGRLMGTEVAAAVARYMEYDKWERMQT